MLGPKITINDNDTDIYCIYASLLNPIPLYLYGKRVLYCMRCGRCSVCGLADQYKTIQKTPQYLAATPYSRIIINIFNVILGGFCQ